MAVFLFDSVRSDGSFGSYKYKMVAELKKTLDEAYKTIELLKKVHSQEANEYKQQISAMQSVIEKLRRQIDDQNHSSNEHILELVDKVHKLVGEMKILSERILPYDCIQDLEAQRFVDASQKLEILSKNETLVGYIIKKVYNGHRENIELLQKFTIYLTNNRLELLVYKSLADVIKETNDQYDTYTVLKLLESVKSFRSSMGSSSDVYKEAGMVLDKLRNIIKKSAANTLILNEFSSNYDVMIFYRVDNDLFYEMISDAFDRVYNTADTSKLLGYASKFSAITIRIDMYTSLFHQMKRNKLHSDSMIELVFDIQEIFHSSQYRDVPSQIKHRFEQLKKDLPPSLSALVFASKVCLIDAFYGEYLYAAGKRCLTLPDSRGVYTRKAANAKKFIYWTIKRRNDGSLSIKNECRNEYLFYLHLLLTWMPKVDRVENDWRIVSTPNGVKIFHGTIDHNKSLVTRDHEFCGDNEDGRIVYAEADSRDKKNIWKIEDCTQYECA